MAYGYFRHDPLGARDEPGAEFGYVCDPRKRRSSESAIWEDVLTAFAGREDIDFAYPTTRFYDNPVEGKPGARAEPPGPV